MSVDGDGVIGDGEACAIVVVIVCVDLGRRPLLRLLDRLRPGVPGIFNSCKYFFLYKTNKNV